MIKGSVTPRRCGGDRLTPRESYLSRSIVARKRKGARNEKTRKGGGEKRESLMEDEGERGGAGENRKRRALPNRFAKTEVNCDENGCSHDHNGA